jgi:hypothetical protein
VPAAFADGAELVAAGWLHTCLGKQGLLTCFGSNGSGQTDVPANLASGVELLSSSGSTTCALLDVDFSCWGNPLKQILIPTRATKMEWNLATKIAASHEYEVCV